MHSSSLQRNAVNWIGAVSLAAASGFLSAAHAATWHSYKSKDAFTGTTNVTVTAGGAKGSGLMVRCDEGHLRVFLRIPTALWTKERKAHERTVAKQLHQLEQVAPGLAAKLGGSHEASAPTAMPYRFRIDHSATYLSDCALTGNLIRFKGGHYVDVSHACHNPAAISGSYVPVARFIHQLRAGHFLVYQIPPKSGPVFRLGLSGSSKELLSAVTACQRQAKSKPTVQERNVKSRRKAEAKKKAEEAKRKAEQRRKQQLQQARAAEEKQRRRQARAAARARQRALNRYVAAIAQKVRRNWRRPPDAPDKFSCTVEVRQMPDGEVLSARVTGSCGSPALDRSVQDAVLRASPLPQPPDPDLFENDLRFAFKPG